MVTTTMAMPCGRGEDAVGLDAHQPGGHRVVGGGAEGAAERGAVENLVQPDDDAPPPTGTSAAA